MVRRCDHWSCAYLVHGATTRKCHGGSPQSAKPRLDPLRNQGFKLRNYPRPKSGFGRENKREFPLLRSWDRSFDRSNGQPERSQDPQTPLNPIRTNGWWNSKKMAPRIMSFVSFHGANLKQGVGHSLSYGGIIFIFLSHRTNPNAKGS